MFAFTSFYDSIMKWLDGSAEAATSPAPTPRISSGMSRTLASLYVGNYRDAKDEKQLSENNITHIISVHNYSKPRNNGREYLCIAANDHPDEDLSIYFPAVNDFIHEARLTNGSVLVHCLAGVSRSVTLVTAYIMTVTDFGWQESLNAIRGARHKAYPNIGFKKLLRVYEQDNLVVERERLRSKFPAANDPFDDKATCQNLLAAYNRWLRFGDQLRDEHESWLVDRLVGNDSNNS